MLLFSEANRAVFAVFDSSRDFQGNVFDRVPHRTTAAIADSPFSFHFNNWNAMHEFQRVGSVLSQCINRILASVVHFSQFFRRLISHFMQILNFQVAELVGCCWRNICEAADAHAACTRRARNCTKSGIHGDGGCCLCHLQSVKLISLLLMGL